MDSGEYSMALIREIESTGLRSSLFAENPLSSYRNLNPNANNGLTLILIMSGSLF